MTRRFWVETLGCPKNQVDSDKLTGTLLADGLSAAGSLVDADVVVVNTCAFIEAARQESIDTILDLADRRAPGAELVVTGCMAERYGAELAEALPEVDRIATFGTPLTDAVAGSDGEVATASAGAGGTAVATPVRLLLRSEVPSFDLLNLPRPATTAPWAYVKVAEGCDRKCGFCAIPSFRGAQRSRTAASILTEVERLVAGGVVEIVLVAQDLASWGRDLGLKGQFPTLVREVAAVAERVRLLYLYPTELSDGLIEVICETGIPYFDLSLQHTSAPLVRRMRRWGNGAKFGERIDAIRAREPEAAFRSNFIVGYPGETEADHEDLLAFVAAARLDWVGFFTYSAEEGTYAAELDGQVPPALMLERLNELTELQDPITAAARDALIGRTIDVLVDSPGIGRSHREAPEIDGVVHVAEHHPVGSVVTVTVTASSGVDLEAS